MDPTLRFETRTLEPYTGGEPSNFQIPTSDGKLRPAHRAGILTFDLGDEPHALTAYTFDGGDDESLFVPFLDRTSGTETYGAGRYLDLEPEDDGTYTLDFNLAYHPSCVYDIRFSVPVDARREPAAAPDRGWRTPRADGRLGEDDRPGPAPGPAQERWPSVRPGPSVSATARAFEPGATR